MTTSERDSVIIDAEIERLAELPIIPYERERPAAAERLGVRAQVLDRLVKAKRPKRKPAEYVPEFDANELQQAADNIIKHPDILDLFAHDLRKVIAGEAINGKLLYLVATSRLFDRP